MAKHKKSRRGHKKARRGVGMMDDLGLENLGLGLGAIDWDQAKGTAIDIAAAVGAGVVGWVGGELLVTTTPYVKDQSENVKSGVLVGLGAIGGTALAMYGNSRASRPLMMAGLGLGVSMALDGVMRLAMPMVKEWTGLNVPQMPAMISLAGLGYTRVSQRRFAELGRLGLVAAQQEVATGQPVQRRQFAPGIA